MTTSASVGDIFKSAGVAFHQLGELTKSLHNQDESQSSNSKWTQTEVDLLRRAVRRFSEDLVVITRHVRTRTEQQMKTSLKRKAYEEAGIPSDKAAVFAAQTVKTTMPSKPKLGHCDAPSDAGEASLLQLHPVSKKQKNSDVTLNALNAGREGDSDVDLVGISDVNKTLEDHLSTDLL